MLTAAIDRQLYLSNPSCTLTALLCFVFTLWFSLPFPLLFPWCVVSMSRRAWAGGRGERCSWPPAEWSGSRFG